MPEVPAPVSISEAERLDAAAYQAICVVTREAVKALLIANNFLEDELATQVSHGYMRGGDARAPRRPFGLVIAIKNR